MDKQIEDLKEKIYITRRCRIVASERFKSWDNNISFINVYYSVILIIISIVSFSSNNPTQNNSLQLSIATTSTSILVFAFSMIGLSMQYKDRYYNFKTSYIKLDHLLKILDSALPEEQFNTYNSVYTKYNDIKDTFENHSTLDYFKYLYSDKYMLEKKISSKSVTLKEVKSALYRNTIFNIIFYFIILTFPFIVPQMINLINLWIINLC